MIRMKQASIKKVIYEDENVIEKVICDKCRKEIQPSIGWEYDSVESQYVTVHTWHNDWGNDSCDSDSINQYCHSCAAEVIKEYVLKDMPSSTCQLEACNVRLYKTKDGRVLTTE